MNRDARWKEVGEFSAMLLKAFLALVPACLLFSGALILFLRCKSTCYALQFVGAGSLVVVALTHVCEALHLFPEMKWGLENSTGHYLDLSSAVLGVTLFPIGYLFDALSKRRNPKTQAQELSK